MKVSLHSNERGIGQVVIIAIAVLVVAGIGLVGWQVTKKKNDSSSSSSQKVVTDKEAVKACQEVFKDKDLCKFTGNYSLDNVSYKMTLTTTGQSGNNSSTYLSDGKGNSSMSGTTNGEKTEFILLNKVSYMKDQSDGVWMKFPANDTTVPKETTSNPTSSVKFDTAKDKAADSTITYKKLGKEKCGKLTCFKYQMIDSTKPNNIDYFWFDTKDYRMQHFYSKDENGTTDMVISYEAVSIKAPSPTKDFNLGTDAGAIQQQFNQSAGADSTPVDTAPADTGSNQAQ